MKGDLTVGAPGQKILRLALPALLSVAFQQLYNIADSMIVGRYCGLDGLAAISAGYPLTALFLGVAVGGSAGVTILVGYYYGSKDPQKVMKAVGTALTAFLSLSGILAGFGLLLGGTAIRVMATPVDIAADARLYLNIYLFGLPFLFLYNVANSIFQALGDGTTPLALLLFSSALNVLLDLLLVVCLGAGVGGAAWATFASQTLAAVTAAALLHKRLAPIREEAGVLKLADVYMLRQLVGYALPGIMQQSFVSVGQLFIQGSINGFGAAVVAGHASAFKVNTIVMMSVNAFGNALSAYTAQNHGAKKMERLPRGYRVTMTAVVLLCLSIIALAQCFGGSFIALFLEKPYNKQALDTGVLFLRLVTPFYILLAVKMTTDCLLKGVGNMRAFAVSTLFDLAVRVGTALIGSGRFGYVAICLSYPAGWVVGIAITMAYYFREPRIKRPLADS
ncbi:MAG: MATE family efflux transporter [Clostridium sp.]|nr:MATE family efflux transporter [Clostridium sp.]